MLLDKEKPENELMVFTNTFAKYQRGNPFRRVLNKNIPLVLLLKIIRLLNNNNAGIAKKEILLLLCWRDDNAESLYVEVKKFVKV
ncbi:hypothetical protein AGMMS49953_05900 [Endomicrobiia bacterium]|nr:hypothetical protein AGMMS49953_05900 [Endomicrobiia bacterium]